MVSVNIEAKKTVDVMIEKADALNIAVETLENGATVLDCGVNVDGSFKAGELYTKVCLGGLADVGISIPGDLSEKFALPSVKIKTDSPSISTLGSQKAGWSVSVGDFFALGSGPARAIALKPAETYEEIGYEDKEADLAILTLEADVLPGEDVAQYIADECNVDVKNVYLLVAPTSSLVGSIQISGRVVENGTYKMLEAIKFDVTKWWLYSRYYAFRMMTRILSGKVNRSETFEHYLINVLEQEEDKITNWINNYNSNR